MTDTAGGAARVGSNEQGLIVACSVEEPARPLTIQVPARRYLGRHPLSVMFRFDAQPPRRYLFEVASNGRRAYTFRPVDVQEILAALETSETVAIRMLVGSDEPLDLNFATHGAAQAIEHVRRGCGAAEPTE